MTTDHPVIGMAGPITLAGLRPYLDGAPSRLPSGLGGVPVTMLVEELLGRGERLVVSTVSRDTEATVHFTGPHLKVSVGPYRRRGRARDAFRLERRAVEAGLRWGGPDLIHAHWAYEFALGALATGLPTLTTLHDWAPAILRFHRDSYRTVRCGMQAATLTRGQSFTAVSPYIAAASGRWRRQAEIIPNGLADEHFTSHEQPRLAPRDRPRFISVNTGFGERKNAGALLEAFSEVRGHRQDAELHLLGSGYQEGGPAHRWAARRGWADGVSFLGARPYLEVLSHMRAADALVHPSLEESFGMTLIEAGAQATPVIAGRRSGAVPWVLDEGAGGMLVDVTDPAEMAQAMVTLVDHPEVWTERSRASFENASTRFRLSRVTDRYTAAYGHLDTGT